MDGCGKLLVHVGHEAGRCGVMHTPQAGDHGSASTCDKAAGQSQQFVGAIAWIQTGFASGQNDDLRCRIHFVNVTHGQPAVGQTQAA